MVAFNFQERFADKVAQWEKNQTIRKTARCKIGDTLQLYTGQRTKNCQKLRDAMCTDVRSITINRGTLEIDGSVMMSDTATRFAIADGFRDYGDMVAFFERQYGLPFSGYVINWE